MPKSKPKPIQINLVPTDPFFATALGKILKWALSVGRYIVIFTELVVIISFLTRFSLDRQVTDLNESIFQKKTIIESYGDLEDRVRAMQKKIDAYKQVEQKENLSLIFPQLQKVTPSGVIFDRLNLSETQIDIQGRALSQNSFTIFVNNLELLPELGQISLNRINTGSEKQKSDTFEFDLKILRVQTQTKK